MPLPAVHLPIAVPLPAIHLPIAVCLCLPFICPLLCPMSALQCSCFPLQVLNCPLFLGQVSATQHAVSTHSALTPARSASVSWVTAPTNTPPPPFQPGVPCRQGDWFSQYAAQGRRNGSSRVTAFPLYPQQAQVRTDPPPPSRPSSALPSARLQCSPLYTGLSQRGGCRFLSKFT